MSEISKNLRTALAFSAGLLTLGACATHAPTSVSENYLEGTVLSRSDIDVVRRTEFLEVEINPQAAELSDQDRARIRAFVGAFEQNGHGPLVMSLPQASSNPQLAVTAVAEARSIAWQSGVQYDEIAGDVHGADETTSQPMILAFQVFDAVAPACASRASIDFGDAASNNNLPTLGCSIRSNLAAMIADPGDLLGNRPLSAGDIDRREVILQKFREGESTAAVRTDQESGTVSQAVN